MIVCQGAEKPEERKGEPGVAGQWSSQNMHSIKFPI